MGAYRHLICRMHKCATEKRLSLNYLRLTELDHAGQLALASPTESKAKLMAVSVVPLIFARWSRTAGGVPILVSMPMLGKRIKLAREPGPPLGSLCRAADYR